MKLEWSENNDGGWDGEAVVTLAHVRYAAVGEVEGGLGALLRFMAGAQGLAQPPLSPEGWYWHGTVERRGVWCRPQGPFMTPGAARAEVDLAFESVDLGTM